MHFRNDVMRIVMAGAIVAAMNVIASANPPASDLLSGPTVSEDAIKEPPRRPGERMAQRQASETPLRDWVAALRELELSDGQKQALRKLSGEFFAERRKFLMSRSESERELIDELPRLRERQREPNLRQREMLQQLESQRPKVEEFQRKMWAILTPQQQEQFKVILAERREHQMNDRSDRRQRRGVDAAGDDMMPMQPNASEQQPAEPMRMREPRRGAGHVDEMSERRLRFLRSRQATEARDALPHKQGEPAAADRIFTFDEDQQSLKSDE